MERLTFALFDQAGFPRSVASEEFRIGVDILLWKVVTLLCYGKEKAEL